MNTAIRTSLILLLIPVLQACWDVKSADICEPIPDVAPGNAMIEWEWVYSDGRENVYQAVPCLPHDDPAVLDFFADALEEDPDDLNNWNPDNKHVAILKWAGVDEVDYQVRVRMAVPVQYDEDCPTRDNVTVSNDPHTLEEMCVSGWSSSKACLAPENRDDPDSLCDVPNAPPPPPPVTGHTGFGDTTPGTPAIGESTPFEVGVRFSSSQHGTISHIRFYRGVGNNGTHQVTMWAADGSILGRATADPVTSAPTGWIEVPLPTPIPILADTEYIVSYSATQGHYAFDQGFFSEPHVSPPLTFPGSVYSDGANSAFPDKTWNQSNYWVDVRFDSAVQE